jgi:predicted NBD/HSP70 family sugar kinase
MAERAQRTDPAATNRIGIDLGGTKIEGAVLARRRRVPARADAADPAGRLRRDAARDRRARRELSELGPARPIGIGTPGRHLPSTVACATPIRSG